MKVISNQYSLHTSEIIATIKEDQSDPRYKALIESIRTKGVIIPLIVRVVPYSEYEVIEGRNRFWAAVAAGYSRVPVVVIDCSDDEAEQLKLELG